MKAAIVGAAGFSGGVLAAHLRKEGWDVAGYDVVQPTRPDAFQDFQLADAVRDPLRFPRGVEGIFYLAQSLRNCEAPEAFDRLFAVNTYGAVRAAEAGCGAGARFFFYASTGNVYEPSRSPLTENHPLRRDDPYALSKVSAEEILRLFTARMAVVSVRLFGLFGPGQQRMLPVTLLHKVRAQEPIVLEPAEGETGDTGGLTISFTYVEDAATCLAWMAQRAVERIPLPHAMNLGGPEPVTIRRFADTLGEILFIDPKYVRAAAVRQMDLIADLTLLRSSISPTFTPFREAMERSYRR